MTNKKQEGSSEYYIGSIILGLTYGLEAVYAPHKSGPLTALALLVVLSITTGHSAHSDKLESNNVILRIEESNVPNCTSLPPLENSIFTDICVGSLGYNCTHIDVIVE